MSDDTPTIDLPTPTTQKQKRARRLVERAYSAPVGDVAFHLDTSGSTAPPEPDWVTIKLLRNYRPNDHYEVLGYWQDEKTRKDSIGQIHVIQANEFISRPRADDDPRIEPKPPAVAGTGFVNKLWAGTVIRVPKDEAKFLRKEGIGEVEID